MLSHVRIALSEEHERIFRLGYDAWGEGAPMAQYLASCLASPKSGSLPAGRVMREDLSFGAAMV